MGGIVHSICRRMTLIGKILFFKSRLNQRKSKVKKPLYPLWNKGVNFFKCLIIQVQLTNHVVLNSNRLSVFQLNPDPILDDMTKRQAVAY